MPNTCTGQTELVNVVVIIIIVSVAVTPKCAIVLQLLSEQSQRQRESVCFWPFLVDYANMYGEFSVG